GAVAGGAVIVAVIVAASAAASASASASAAAAFATTATTFVVGMRRRQVADNLDHAGGDNGQRQGHHHGEQHSRGNRARRPLCGVTAAATSEHHISLSSRTDLHNLHALACARTGGGERAGSSSSCRGEEWPTGNVWTQLSLREGTVHLGVGVERGAHERNWGSATARRPGGEPARATLPH